MPVIVSTRPKTIATTTAGGTGGSPPADFPATYCAAISLGAIGFIGVFANSASDANSFSANPADIAQTSIAGVFMNGSDGTTPVEAVKPATDPLRATITLLGK